MLLHTVRGRSGSESNENSSALSTDDDEQLTYNKVEVDYREKNRSAGPLFSHGGKIKSSTSSITLSLHSSS